MMLKCLLSAVPKCRKAVTYRNRYVRESWSGLSFCDGEYEFSVNQSAVQDIQTEKQVILQYSREAFLKSAGVIFVMNSGASSLMLKLWKGWKLAEP